MAASKSFPTFAVVLLVLALLWILSATEVLVIDIPWLPVIIGIVALGMILNHYGKK